MKRGNRGSAFFSFLFLFFFASIAFAQSDEEKFKVGSRFIEVLISPSYIVHFIDDCEMYAIDEFIGDEYLILFESISPSESYFDRDSMELFFKSEAGGGIFASEFPDKIEREVDEVSFFGNDEELEKLTEQDFDSIDTNLVLVLEFFRDTCRG